MTYNQAKQIKIGDVLWAKGGGTFTVGKITEKTDAANIRKYIVFYEIIDGCINRFYTHQQIIEKVSNK